MQQELLHNRLDQEVIVVFTKKDRTKSDEGAGGGPLICTQKSYFFLLHLIRLRSCNETYQGLNTTILVLFAFFHQQFEQLLDLIFKGHKNQSFPPSLTHFFFIIMIELCSKMKKKRYFWCRYALCVYLLKACTLQKNLHPTFKTASFSSSISKRY